MTREPAAPGAIGVAADLYTYRCGECGDSATWQAPKRQVMCRSCGTVVPLPTADQTRAGSFYLVPYLRDSPENRRTVKPTRVERSCPACNHVVVFEPGFEGATCGACLTPLLRPPHEGDMPIRPTGIVPFRIDEAEARERLRMWWRGLRGYDPRTRNLEPGPLVARYLPQWQFSVRVHCSWRHRAEDAEGRTRTYEGSIRGDYGEREPGNHSVPGDLLRALPFPFEHAVAYDRRYLAGAIVEQYDGDLFRAWDAARWRLDDLVKRLVADDSKILGGPEEYYTSWSEEKGWLILTPFYTTDIDIHGKHHHIVIDGHSGQIASSVPPFIPRVVWLLVGGIVAALAALGWAVSMLTG